MLLFYLRPSRRSFRIDIAWGTISDTGRISLGESAMSLRRLVEEELQ